MAAGTAADASVAERIVTISGGDKMQARLKEIMHRLGHGSVLSVGFLADATYPAKIADDIKAKFKVRGKNKAARQAKAAASGLHVATVAFWNEFGTATTPARPFMRSTVAKKAPTWGRALGIAARDNGYDALGTLTAMGFVIQGQIQQSIYEWSDPPNAARTVQIKGFNKPLIDTAVMSRAVDFEVNVT